MGDKSRVMGIVRVEIERVREIEMECSKVWSGVVTSHNEMHIEMHKKELFKTILEVTKSS